MRTHTYTAAFQNDSASITLTFAADSAALAYDHAEHVLFAGDCPIPQARVTWVMRADGAVTGWSSIESA